ncbi:MAG: MBL fold metallo-hydrolase [Firmicutes bacterium]|nr:MBL fold metallo-hydrolase [Bacillota bacterium]
MPLSGRDLHLGRRDVWPSILCALFLAGLLAAVQVVPAAAGSRAPGLLVEFFDVGQGDATLLSGPDFTILIDAGRHDRADVVPHLEAAGVRAIDLFILTHPHADHIGQCAAVIQRFPVREVWYSGDVHTSLTFERCLDAILASDAAYHEPRAGETFQIGSARLEVVHPAEVTGDYNNGSIGVRIAYGDVVFLFTGDAESEAEAEMLTRGHPLRAHVLQLGHHGSRTSSSSPFLEAVRPEVAVYSAGRDNPYGHPHEEALRRVAGAGAVVYGTDVNGTIRVYSDGKAYEVVPERGKPVRVMPGAARSSCAPGQVDVNSAGVEELVRIIHIGPALARRIIEERPFESVDELIRVSGIGQGRLADIKEQGLACAGEM